MKSKSSEGYVKLAGSLKQAPHAVQTDNLNTGESIEVTVRMRRKKSIEESLKKEERFTREEYEQVFGTSDEDIQVVESFAYDHHLAIVNIDRARRSMMLRGKISDFSDAFRVHLSQYKNADGSAFRGRVGHISIPRLLQDIVEGVFGLDNRPAASPRFQVLKDDGNFVAHAAATQGFYPNEVAKVYAFPSNADGQGQCIAIIELGGGFRTNDLQQYFKTLGLKVPVVSAVSVDGGSNRPSNAGSADGEVMLDIEVAGVIAPSAKIAVYFAPNTDKGFLDAITKAVHDTYYKPSVISISWGAAEKNWTAQSLTGFNEAFKAASLLGVTICAAAGDEGSSDGVNDGKVHVDFPASSPYVLACGGTRLQVSGNKISAETAWHVSNTSATGGGVSDVFALPEYQQNTKVPLSVSTKFKGRGLPDVAGNADPNSGYKVLVDGENLVIGGTSAVAPLMAGLIALLNQQKKQPAGFIHPRLYANPKLCRDISEGDNITTTTHLGYTAGTGWDPCTGFGVLSHL